MFNVSFGEIWTKERRLILIKSLSIILESSLLVQIKKQSYIDNIGLSDLDMGRLTVKTQQADMILEQANMKVKRWIVSGDSQGEVEAGDLSDNLTLEDVEI